MCWHSAGRGTPSTVTGTASQHRDVPRAPSTALSCAGSSMGLAHVGSQWCQTPLQGQSTPWIGHQLKTRLLQATFSHLLAWCSQPVAHIQLVPGWNPQPHSLGDFESLGDQGDGWRRAGNQGVQETHPSEVTVGQLAGNCSKVSLYLPLSTPQILEGKPRPAWPRSKGCPCPGAG